MVMLCPWLESKVPDYGLGWKTLSEEKFNVEWIKIQNCNQIKLNFNTAVAFLRHRQCGVD